MKKIIIISFLAAMLTGCCSYTEIAKPSPHKNYKIDDGETPIATVSVFNVGYSLFGIWPIESGTVWKAGPYSERDHWNAAWFTNNCTLDENLKSVKAALNEIGSNKIMNLVTESDSWRFWSLFIIKREVMKSTCTVLR